MHCLALSEQSDEECVRIVDVLKDYGVQYQLFVRVKLAIPVKIRPSLAATFEVLAKRPSRRTLRADDVK